MNKIKEVQQIQNNLQIDTTECELLKIQIDNINEKEIQIQGRVFVNASFCDINIMEDSTYKFIKKITEDGLYTVDVAGFNSIKFSTSGDVSGYVSSVLK